MKKYMITLNDKIYEVEIEEVTEEVTEPTVEEEDTIAQVSSQDKLNNSKNLSGAETVEASMPGNILEFL
ncbi:hypothetical protein LGK95_16490 [Clostridium algoriphilum]|uniref:hypothetical protein n=1 Tax=Clostridium algoriphilum TaxID=198347 RepID=UPI001CF532D2|nr:hypothetical protein [Clostridium algoriphilum]MCB2295083.1 hypothetical protein [Clostridium algoriphilum]